MMRIFTLLFAIILCGSMNAQLNVIWGGPGDPNGEFDGGLNDWTAIAVSPNEEALWFWDEDGAANQGAFFGMETPINSASVANGAASYDSDFHDNGGDPDSVFAGIIAAAPQQTELLSPEFSTLGFDNVAVTWTQSMRRFQTNAFAIHVTTDGGATFTEFPIDFNNNYPVNAGSINGQQLTVDVSSAMGNQESVQFKFVYNANYYFWTIDDVAVIETPAVDLQVIDIFYPFPAANIPDHMMNADTLDFAFDFWNGGIEDLADATATVEILDENDEVVMGYSQSTGMVAAGDTLEFVFDDVLLPADVQSSLGQGTYTIVYDVQPVDVVDPFPSDNGAAEAFAVTEDLYDLTQTIITANSFNGGLYAPGIVFRTGDLPGGMVYFLTTALFNGATNSGSISNSIGNVALYEVDQVGEEIDSVFTNPAWGADADHENLELVGFTFFNAQGIVNFTDILAELLDAETTDVGVILKENQTYILSYMWDITNEGETVFSSTSDLIDYFQPVNLVHIPDQGWFFVAEELAWYMPFCVQSLVVNTEITELDENTVSVYPNPAINFTTVDLEFKEATDAAIILRDARGSYISTTSVYGVTNQQVEINIADLPAGTYSFEVTTTNNERTVKSFVKVQ